MMLLRITSPVLVLGGTAAVLLRVFLVPFFLAPSSIAWTSSAPLQTHSLVHQRTQSRLFLTPDADTADFSKRTRTRTKQGKPNPARKSKQQQLPFDVAMDYSSSSSSSTTTASSSFARQQAKQTGRRRRRRSSGPTSGAEQQLNELLSHEILTRTEDFELGEKIVRANQLRTAMATLIQDKRTSLEQEISRQIYSEQQQKKKLSSNNYEEDGEDEEASLFDPNGIPISSGEERSLENHFQNQRERGMTGLDELDDRLLTDQDIVTGLNLVGGRSELHQILTEGAFARDRLIRSNVRLAVDIAKRWAKQSSKPESLASSPATLFAGSSSRPSLDEAIQEGILGLTKAADKYEPSRGYRFSTYSTYWVTSYVRRCFQRASTGTLRIPEQYHAIKNKHSKLLIQYKKEGKEIPTDEDMAREVGVSVYRLNNALQLARPVLSIDAPIFDQPARESDNGNNPILFSDSLQSTEAQPEDQVELSFLRQRLENAMASELSPHERDVVRLRHGLDDGVSRTRSEVKRVLGYSGSLQELRGAEYRAYLKLRHPRYGLVSFFDFAGIASSREHAQYGQRTQTWEKETN